ncbi:chloride channel, partial [Coemansia sp. RSA 25]
MTTGGGNGGSSRSASAPVSSAPGERSRSADGDESGYDSEDIPYFEDLGRGHSVVPMRRIRSSQERLIQQSSGSDMDAITGWLYNGPLQRAKYQDFSTIDWIYDNTKARHYKSDLRARARSMGRMGKLELLADSSKPWLVLLAVGFAMGLIATCISVSSQWLIDIKQGHCRTGFYLNRRFCCWNADDVCMDWVMWSEHLHTRWRWVEWLLQYMVFMLDAILFAAISTYLVTEYAPYAAGQGIAEIKTIMSGFMMRKFLGLRTLCIKCVGIVLSVASGLSLGKEGAMVHIACCCSNVFARAFKR